MRWAASILRGGACRTLNEAAAPRAIEAQTESSYLNASYLSTVFAREAGLPFKAYLAALRLEHAEVLLSDPCLPISQVAKTVGYVSPHRFRAVFRASTGLSPGRWRVAQLVEGESYSRERRPRSARGPGSRPVAGA